MRLPTSPSNPEHSTLPGRFHAEQPASTKQIMNGNGAQIDQQMKNTRQRFNEFFRQELHQNQNQHMANGEFTEMHVGGISQFILLKTKYFVVPFTSAPFPFPSSFHI